MIQAALGIAILGFFAVMGLRLMATPKSFLAKFGRPATQKHVRATRFIGFSFLLFVAMAVVSWVRQPR